MTLEAEERALASQLEIVQARLDAMMLEGDTGRPWEEVRQDLLCALSALQKNAAGTHAPPAQVVELIERARVVEAIGSGLADSVAGRGHSHEEVMAFMRQLTTQEAADMLNVSHPHLISLLDEGRVPFSKTGTQRRIRAADVMAYKAERDAEHAAILRELTAEAQKLKLGY